MLTWVGSQHFASQIFFVNLCREEVDMKHARLRGGAYGTFHACSKPLQDILNGCINWSSVTPTVWMGGSGVDMYTSHVHNVCQVS